MTRTRLMNVRASVLVLVLVWLFLLSVPSSVVGDDAVEAKSKLVQIVTVGLLAHDVDNLWSGFRREEGADFNGELAFKTLYEFSHNIVLYPAVGVSINNRGDTSKAYGDFRFEHRDPSGFFIGLGLGAAIHDGKLDTSRRDRKSLGSRVLFHIPFELGKEFLEHHRISLFFDHVSNAYLADENQGLDTLGVRYGYKF